MKKKENFNLHSNPRKKRSPKKKKKTINKFKEKKKRKLKSLATRHLISIDCILPFPPSQYKNSSCLVN